MVNTLNGNNLVPLVQNFLPSINGKPITGGFSVSPDVVANVLLAGDNVSGGVLIVTGSDDVPMNLPQTMPSSERKIFIKRTDAGKGRVVIQPAGSSLIDGQPEYFLVDQNQFVEIFSDGLDWYITKAN